MCAKSLGQQETKARVGLESGAGASFNVGQLICLWPASPMTR